MRVGLGYDVHPLVPGRPLVLGGVAIPYERGLLGHSDGDVAVHAIMDALLGAAGLRDIGTYFPSSDPRYAGVSSLKLLGKVKEMLRENGWGIINIDVVVLAEAPRLQPFIEEMKRRLGEALALSPDLIAIKATTNEGLGFIGHGEGIAAFAIAAVDRSEAV